MGEIGEGLFLRAEEVCSVLFSVCKALDLRFSTFERLPAGPLKNAFENIYSKKVDRGEFLARVLPFV